MSIQADTQLLDSGVDWVFWLSEKICCGEQVGGQEIPINYQEVQGEVWIWTPKRSACLKTGWEAEDKKKYSLLVQKKTIREG